MKTYAVKHYLPPELTTQATADWALVVGFMQALPEPPFVQEMQGKDYTGLAVEPPDGPYWTCHALARAAKAALPLQLPWIVADGYYCRHFDHSWLECRVDGRKIVLDVYPVGAMTGPHLVGTSGYGVYRPWNVKDFPGRKTREAFHTHVPAEAQLALAAYRAAMAERAKCA